MKHQESSDQQALFQWSKLMQGQYPELSLLHSIPNGGKRNLIEAVRMKKEGIKSGVFDMFMPVARGDYHGIYLEMKIKGGRVSDNQKWWQRETTKQGYLSVICYGWEDARKEIINYLGT
jgi:hypothetical protein